MNSVLYVFIAVFSSVFCSVCGLTITVNSINGTELYRLVDDSAAFEDRVFQVPEEYNNITGILVLPGKEPCNHVPPLDTNLSVIAFVKDYYLCSQSIEYNLYMAHYSAMLVVSWNKNSFLKPLTPLAQALIVDDDFALYLEKEVVVSNFTNYTSYVRIWDNSFAKLERLFIIFGSILMASIFLAVFIFCCSFCCRAIIQKFRTRGLTHWQVRQLPRRRYRTSKETSETCSICLEDFKEGVTIRVLPCSHVFHPKCVDEWLRKWNRTCPLCKSTIKRNGRSRANVDTADENSLLLSEEGNSTTRVSFNEGATPSNYGATISNSMSRSTESPPGLDVPESTTEADTLQPSSLTEREFHTPLQSSSEYDKDTVSYATANEDTTSTTVQ